MQYCKHCSVQVRGDKKFCPLCANSLPDGSDDADEVFPDIPPAYERHLVIRIVAFISIASLVISFAVYTIFPFSVNWPMFVVFGLISMWLSLILVIRKRYNVTKNIMWQVLIVSLLSVFWDWKTGWRGWSLEYIIPIVCVAAMIVMYVVAKAMKLSVRDYIAYLLLDGLFGIVPVLFVVFNWIRVLYPSILCVSVSIIFLSAILIFQGENIKIELKKRMHI